MKKLSLRIETTLHNSEFIARKIGGNVLVAESVGGVYSKQVTCEMLNR